MTCSLLFGSTPSSGSAWNGFGLGGAVGTTIGSLGFKGVGIQMEAGPMLPQRTGSTAAAARGGGGGTMGNVRSAKKFLDDPGML